MKNAIRIIAVSLITAGISLTSTVSAEIPAKTQKNTTTTTPSKMPASAMDGMTTCAPAAMKDGKCPQGNMGGMDSTHMKQMHEHMQQMHSQTIVPAVGTTPAVKPDATGKPASAEDHAAHHPAQ